MKGLSTEKEIVNLYNNNYIAQGLSTNKLAAHLGCNPSTIQRAFRKHGLPLRNNSHSKIRYKIDERYFDNIDSEEKAYFLGFLFADGTNNGRQIRIGLHLKDVEILKRFSKIIYNADRVRVFPKSPDLAYLTISNIHMSQQLTNHGCGPAKTFKLKFPHQIDDNLHKHFIRGLFDGDGSLSFSVRPTKQNPINRRYYWGLTSTEAMLKSIAEIFENELNVRSRFQKRWKCRDTNITSLRILGGNFSILKTCKWLYDKATIALPRKAALVREFQHKTSA